MFRASYAFPGRVVRKDLVQRLKVGFSIPVYVLEYLLGKYCSTTDEAQIASGLQSVKDMIAERMRRAFWGRLTGNTGPLGKLNDRELVSLRRLLGTALRRPAS